MRLHDDLFSAFVRHIWSKDVDDDTRSDLPTVVLEMPQFIHIQGFLWRLYADSGELDRDDMRQSGFDESVIEWVAEYPWRAPDPSTVVAQAINRPVRKLGEIDAPLQKALGPAFAADATFGWVGLTTCEFVHHWKPMPALLPGQPVNPRFSGLPVVVLDLPPTTRRHSP